MYKRDLRRRAVFGWVSDCLVRVLCRTATDTTAL